MTTARCPLCKLPLETTSAPDGNTGEWTIQLTKKAARHVTSRHPATNEGTDK